MKVIFYKEMLKEQRVTPTDKIVFCQMLYTSLMDVDDRFAFDNNGNFTLEVYKNDFMGLVPISRKVNVETMMDVLHINRRQYFLSCQRLKEAGYIVKDGKAKYLRLIEMVPYFKLYIETGLCGNELIVYSYIKSKNDRYGDVDKFHDSLAKDLGITFWSLEKVLSALYKKGAIKGERKGRQVLLKTKLPTE